MRRKTVLFMLLLFATTTIYGESHCGDQGNDKRHLSYVQHGQEKNEDAPILKLLPGCHFSWQNQEGTYAYCSDCNNRDADILIFERVTLPWGQKAVLHSDTDLVFAHEVRGQTVLTTLKMRRGWSLCPLWPICTGR